MTTDTVITRRVLTETRTTTTHDFAAKDKYGRAVGCVVETCTIDYVEEPRTSPYQHSLNTPGRVFAFRPQATRNGERYGPSQSHEEFATAAERDAAVEKYLKGAAKRATKKA